MFKKVALIALMLLIATAFAAEQEASHTLDLSDEDQINDADVEEDIDDESQLEQEEDGPNVHWVPEPEVEDPNELVDTLPSEIVADLQPEHYASADEKDDDEVAAADDGDSDDEDEDPTDINLLDEEDQQKQGRCRGRATAYAVGDPHFRSFDGRIFHFQGIGQFLLANCDRMMLEARNFVCGRHRYYGVVGCWRQAAVRYCDATQRNCDVAEITTRGRQILKFNGKSVHQWKAITNTKSGMVVRPKNVKICWRCRRGRRWSRCCRMQRYVVVSAPGHNDVTVTTYAIYYTRPRCKKCHKALLGNDNANGADDYIDHNGRNWGGSLRSVASQVDNNPKKAIHLWGMTFMVKRGNNIANIFDSGASKWNKPKFVPTPIKFKSKAFKLQAHKFCKHQGFSYNFYVDCMEDCAKTGSINMAKKDSASFNLWAKMKKTHKNYHHGKSALMKTLGKMEIDFLSTRDMIKSNMAHAKKRCQNGKVFYNGRVGRRKRICRRVGPLRGAFRRAAGRHNRMNGARIVAIRYWRKMYPKWIVTIVRIKREDKLIRKMLTILARLVGVKSVEELDLDQNELNKSPELKKTFTEFIQRAHRGHTNVVKKLLLQLLYKFKVEIRVTKRNIVKARKNKNTTILKEKLRRKIRNRCKHNLNVGVRNCRRARASERAALLKFRGWLRARARLNRNAGKQLRELMEEMRMVRYLQKVVMGWSKNKGFGRKHLKKCRRDEDEADVDESAAPTDAEMKKIDDSIPVAADEDKTAPKAEEEDSDTEADLEEDDMSTDEAADLASDEDEE